MVRFGRDVVVSDVVYWALVKLKFGGQYRSIDEVLRPMLGIRPGARPRLRSYTRRTEDMQHNGNNEELTGDGACPPLNSALPREHKGEAIISSFFRVKRFLSEAIFKRGGVFMPRPVICPHCHAENIRRRQSVGKDEHGFTKYVYGKIYQCRECGAQIDRDLLDRIVRPGQKEIGGFL